MRKRRGYVYGKSGFLVKAAVLFLFISVAVRFIGSGRISEALSGCLFDAVNQPGFARLAMSSTINGGNLNDDEGEAQKWLNILKSENAAQIDFSPSELQTEDDAELETASAFIPWIIKPAKKENGQFPIQAIAINPISQNGYDVYDKAYVKNDTSKKIDMQYLTKAKLPFALKGKGPHVLIVHTHGSESYFPDGKDTYTPTDVERTEDKKYNVIRVGDELEAVLKKGGINAIHDRNIYDSPSYNGSYTRTLNAITQQMKKTPSIKVIIDVHRDAMTTKEGVKYKTVAEINDKTAAQIMVVMSTGESGLPHPDWAENLKFAVQLQNKVQNKYPGLMRPINLRQERFNMHVVTGSMLVEVGTSANTLQEALYGIQLFGEELAGMLKTVK